MLNCKAQESRHAMSPRLVLFRLVGSPLQLVEVELFINTRCMFPSRMPLEGADRVSEFWAITSGPQYLG
jgi:hypothetical protein